MILVRKFIFEEDPEYGNNGWRPLWMKGATANSGDGRLVAHDILEHHPNMELGAEAEFHALGASYWIRGENGGFNHTIYSPEEQYAADFPSILQRVDAGDETLKDPGVTRPLSEDLYGGADSVLMEIVRKGFRLTAKEYDYPLRGLPMFARKRVLGWMRKGYRYARQRYGHATDGYSVNSLFVKTAEAVNRVTRHSELGMEMTVRLDVRRCEVKAFAEYLDLDSNY